MTAAEFPYKVGDKVRLQQWPNDRHMTITAVGTRLFTATDRNEYEWSWEQHCDWQPYSPPPERTRWIVTTERRVPKVGEACLDDSGVPFIATEWHDRAGGMTNVQVDVERAE